MHFGHPEKSCACELLLLALLKGQCSGVSLDGLARKVFVKLTVRKLLFLAGAGEELSLQS